jgi:hypothetical protein
MTHFRIEATVLTSGRRGLVMTAGKNIGREFLTKRYGSSSFTQGDNLADMPQDLQR